MDAKQTSNARKKDKINHENDTYAPEIDMRVNRGEDLPTRNISNGLIDYSLKCIKGYHKGKFMYLNLTPHGEIFGSDPDDPNLTMYIQNGNIDKKHCQINYKNGFYHLNDLNSSTGTWIRQSNYDPVLITQSTEIQIGGDLFTFKFGEKITDPVIEWFKKYGLTSYGEKIKEIG
jgi:hypothetical protein